MIEVQGLTKAYGATTVVEDVSFRAPRGSITAFVGPNGAGKSTVLRILTGLLAADRGDATIAGRPFAKTPHPGSAVGVFLSAESMPPAVRARDYLEYVARLKGINSDAADGALQVAGLSSAGRVRVRAMSLGMRQRLGIAAAQLGDPAVLVFDEPVNGLDPEGVRWFRGYLRERAAAGATVLLSSHQMGELEQVADRVVMIERGRIVSEGSVSEFVAPETAPPVFVRAVRPEALAAALAARGWEVRPHDDGLLVSGASAVDVGRLAFQEAGGLHHLTTVARSLEQTYFDRLAADGQEAVR